MEKFKVTFYPDKKTVEVAKDTTILAAGISAGIYITSSCGGEGVCGRCKVIVRKGKVFSQSAGRITSDEKKRGIHLACISAVQGDLEVEIPPESRLSLEGLTEDEINARLKKDYSSPEDIESPEIAPAEGIFPHSPLAVKLYVELKPPTLDDKVSDLERLNRQIQRIKNTPSIQTGLTNIRSLGELLRSSEWKVTVTLGKRNDATEITFIEPGDNAGKNYGFCFDIGTTTVSAQLVDLNNGKVLGTKATYNKQAAFGSDVITRIIYAKEEDGLENLHQAVADDMNEMIKELVRENGVDLNDVTCVVCAGNTTMIHLLMRIDPTYIRKEPYAPVLNFVPAVRASEVELRINPRGLLHCVPGVASYVGGDVTAGVIDSGIYKKENLSILIDIGTNGEIVLGNKEFLIAAAASAGPAFEGSGVSCGMRATLGAVQKVEINPGDFEAKLSVIGAAKPRGICGSGYIDLIAGMLKAGILDKDGKIKPLKHKRLREGESGPEFVVAFPDEAGSSGAIVITGPDIENLKRAKAAIYSAASILVKHMGFTFSQVETIFIAGGFGAYLDIQNAIRIGLLPDLERSKFLFIGNSSLGGARKILLSADAMRKAEEIARQIAYFELSVEAGYMEEYMAALFFPHTDLSLFPSVVKG
jgi:uncharacterized 2Fe-2S/4Fe-4S cluster protein (DUF4445 family)